MPKAATTISRDFRTKYEKIAATYLAILRIEEVYFAFVNSQGLADNQLVKKSTVLRASFSAEPCGVYPFC